MTHIWEKNQCIGNNPEMTEGIELAEKYKTNIINTFRV